MDDKMFDLMSRLYSEFTDFRKETKVDIQGIKNQMTSLEHDLKKDISTLYDGYMQTYEKLDVIEEKLDTLSEKVDRHDIKIQVIEGGCNR